MRRCVSRSVALIALSLLAGCAGVKQHVMTEHECMTRVMYFESNRSSEEGMVAVGTVVMNRVKSEKYPNSVCAVVAQKNQFAPGVLSKPMGAGRELAEKTARKVLRGARHTGVGERAMFFHTAGYSYPYKNMHYVAIAGGNAFYEKRKNPTQTQEMLAQRPVPQLSPRSRPSAVALAPRPTAVAASLTIEDIIASGALN